jgi:hypothetical protein
MTWRTYQTVAFWVCAVGLIGLVAYAIARLL